MSAGRNKGKRDVTNPIELRERVEDHRSMEKGADLVMVRCSLSDQRRMFVPLV